MKKIALLILALLIMLSSLTLATADNAADYSFLDGMTLDELTALKTEVESRISKEKANAAASNTDDLGIWQVRYYVDEFQLPTTEGYITTTQYVIGTFSNSATTNSTLKVVWLIDKDDVAIKLLEYGSNVVKSSYDSTTYSILMLDPDNNRVSMTGTMYKGSDRIYIGESYESTVLEALKKNGSVTFKIEEQGKYATSSYLFTMSDTSYFSNAYNKLMGTN